MQGQTKFFDLQRFFGIVRITDSWDCHGEYFFHGSRVLGDRMPERFELVSFWLDDDPNQAGRLVAIDVLPIGMPSEQRQREQTENNNEGDDYEQIFEKLPGDDAHA
jgi:hypothetical protein